MKRRKHRSRSKKNPITHRAAVRRAKKAARTRKRHKAEKRASSRRSASKRKHGGGKRKAHRKSPKRVRAARKAARTRKRRYGQVTKREREELDRGGYGYEARRKRGRRRKKNPIAAEAPRKRKRAKRRKKSGGRHRARHAIRASKSRKRGRRHSVKGHYRKGGRGRRRSYVKRHMSHEESRRRPKRRRNKRRHSRRSRAREARRHRGRRGHRRNPIQGPIEFFMSVLGVATGYVLASGVDRYLSTAPISGAGAQEQPPAGSIYNSEAVALPIWSSWQRLLAGAASVGVPLFIAGFLRNPAGKSFFQLAGFGALARTAGKAADDGLAMVAMKMTNPNPTLVRLYAPEIAAIAKAASVIPPNQLPAAPTATFAGLPRHIGRVGQSDPSGLSTTDANGNPFVLDPNGNVVMQIMQAGGTCPSGWSMIPNSEYCGQLATPSPPPPTPPPTMSPPPPVPPPQMVPPPLPPPPMPPSVPLTPPSMQNDCQPVVNPIPPATGPSVGPFNPLYACPDGQC